MSTGAERVLRQQLDDIDRLTDGIHAAITSENQNRIDGTLAGAVLSLLGMVAQIRVQLSACALPTLAGLGAGPVGGQEGQRGAVE